MVRCEILPHHLLSLITHYYISQVFDSRRQSTVNTNESHVSISVKSATFDNAIVSAIKHKPDTRFAKPSTE